MSETHPEALTPREEEAEQTLPEQTAEAAREAGAPVAEAGAEDEGRLPVAPAGTGEDADAPVGLASDEAQAGDAEGEDAAPAKTREERIKELEEEGDIAADYLEELLDIADLDGDIDIDVDGDRASVEIRGATQLAKLNEPRGELLDALQELTRLAVQSSTGSRSRLMLDIGGYRAQHKGSLEQLAEDAVNSVKQDGEPVALRPMNPFERKVVHDVAKQAGLRSESEGDGKDRHVVIHPAS